MNVVLPELHMSTGAAIDLGAGTGAFAMRLSRSGITPTCLDSDPSVFAAASLPFVLADMNAPDWFHGLGTYQLVTAIEVIEHLESPIALLRAIHELLDEDGVAVVTTPHVESLMARAKFAAKGVLRQFDEFSDPTHVSPIFRDLLIRHYLPRSRLRLEREWFYPQMGHISGRPSYRRISRVLHLVIRRVSLWGDVRVVALRRAPKA